MIPRFLIVVVLFLNPGAVFGFPERTVHEHMKLPSAEVVGTVFCDTCFQQRFSGDSRLLSGVSVSVECHGPLGQAFRQEAMTDKHGDFRVKLPFSVTEHVRKIDNCIVKLISSNEPHCSVASSASSTSLRLQSKRLGTHVFSAGFFTFKPLKEPTLCMEKASLKEKKANKGVTRPKHDPTFSPPTQDTPTPSTGFLPPRPFFPSLPPLPKLPPLPSLPSLPKISFPPKPKEPTVGKNSLEANSKPETSTIASQKAIYPEFFLPPNPFRSSFFPPNPFQAPSMFPLNPLQPAPLNPQNPLQPPPPPAAPLVIPLPPILELTPPPPSPSLPFHFPWFRYPYAPSVPFPVIPPASSSPVSSSPSSGKP